MGTRSMTKVVLDGKEIISQYGEIDGYPTYGGAILRDFIKKNGKQGILDAVARVVTIKNDCDG